MTVDIPLALSWDLILDIVDSITRSWVALVIAGFAELGTEGFVVLFLRDVIKDDFLLVVGDLEDDELGLAVAHAELIVCVDAFVPDGDTNYRIRQPCPQWCQVSSGAR